MNAQTLIADALRHVEAMRLCATGDDAQRLQAIAQRLSLALGALEAK